MLSRRAPEATQRFRYRGFTLVELLVVIAIIGVLVALLLPAVQSAREAARRMQCQNHLKQMGVALHNHHDVLRHLPNSRRDASHTWAVELLPFMEQKALHEQWALTKSYYSQTKIARETPIATYFCPSRRSHRMGTSGSISVSPNDIPDGGSGSAQPGALADYAVSVGSSGRDYWWDGNGSSGGDNTTLKCRGAFKMANNWSTVVTQPKFVPGIRLAEITDGTSSTIFIGEKHVQSGKFGSVASDHSTYNGDKSSAHRGAGPSYALARNPKDTVNNRFGSYHPGVCQFVMADGSVRGVRVQVNTTVLGNLADIADGNTVSDGDL